MLLVLEHINEFENKTIEIPLKRNYHLFCYQTVRDTTNDLKLFISDLFYCQFSPEVTNCCYA